MPNQLSQTKKRKTVAENAAVLALLDHIAEVEGTTSTDLLRSAARDIVRQYVERDTLRKDMERIFQSYQPILPRVCSFCLPKVIAFKTQQLSRMLPLENSQHRD